MCMNESYVHERRKHTLNCYQIECLCCISAHLMWKRGSTFTIVMTLSLKYYLSFLMVVLLSMDVKSSSSQMFTSLEAVKLKKLSGESALSNGSGDISCGGGLVSRGECTGRSWHSSGWGDTSQRSACMCVCVVYIEIEIKAKVKTVSATTLLQYPTCKTVCTFIAWMMLVCVVYLYKLNYLYCVRAEVYRMLVITSQHTIKAKSKASQNHRITNKRMHTTLVYLWMHEFYCGLSLEVSFPCRDPLYYYTQHILWSIPYNTEVYRYTFEPKVLFFNHLTKPGEDFGLLPNDPLFPNFPPSTLSSLLLLADGDLGRPGLLLQCSA